MIKKCILCGTEFESTQGCKKYCSKKCARTAWKRQRNEIAKIERTKKIAIENDPPAPVNPKTDWEAIVRKCNELHISYGEAVRRGLI